MSVSARAWVWFREGEALTCNHLGPLEVLIRMQIARGESEPKPHEHQQQIHAPPHGCGISPILLPLFCGAKAEALAGSSSRMGLAAGEQAGTSGYRRGSSRRMCGADRSCRAGAGWRIGLGWWRCSSQAPGDVLRVCWRVGEAVRIGRLFGRLTKAAHSRNISLPETP